MSRSNILLSDAARSLVAAATNPSIQSGRPGESNKPTPSGPVLPLQSSLALPDRTIVSPEVLANALGIEVSTLGNPRSAVVNLNAALKEAATDRFRVVDNDGQPVPVVRSGLHCGYTVPPDVIRTVVLHAVQRQIEAGNLSQAALTLIHTGLARGLPESDLDGLRKFGQGYCEQLCPEEHFKPLSEEETAELTKLWQSKLPTYLSDLLYQLHASEELGPRVMREVQFHCDGQPIHFSGREVKGSRGSGYGDGKAKVDGINSFFDEQRESVFERTLRGERDDRFEIYFGAFAGLFMDNAPVPTLETPVENSGHWVAHQPLMLLRKAVGSVFGPTAAQLSEALIGLKRTALERGAQPSVVDRYFAPLLGPDGPELSGEERQLALQAGLRATKAFAEMSPRSTRLNKMYEYYAEGVLPQEEFEAVMCTTVNKLAGYGQSKKRILQEFPFLTSFEASLDELFEKGDRKAAQRILDQLRNGRASDADLTSLDGFIQRGLVSSDERDSAVREGTLVRARDGDWKELEAMLLLAPRDKWEQLYADALNGRRERILTGTPSDSYKLLQPDDAAVFPNGFPTDASEAAKLLEWIEEGLHPKPLKAPNTRSNTIAFIRALLPKTDDMRWVNTLPGHFRVWLFGVDIVAKALESELAKRPGTQESILRIAPHLGHQPASSLYLDQPEKLQDKVDAVMNRRVQTRFDGTIVPFVDSEEVLEIVGQIGRDKVDWFNGLSPEHKEAIVQQAATRVGILRRLEYEARPCKPERSASYAANAAHDDAVQALQDAAVVAHHQSIALEQEESQAAAPIGLDLPPLPENMPIAEYIRNGLNRRIDGRDFPQIDELDEAGARALVTFTRQNGLGGWIAEGGARPPSPVGLLPRRGVSPEGRTWRVYNPNIGLQEGSRSLKLALGLLLEGVVAL